jgi:hypothetical protein
MKAINILFILIILTACRKERETIIEGTLIGGCDTPLANVNALIITPNHKIFGPEVRIPFTTNQNGFFSVRYKGRERFNSFAVHAFIDLKDAYHVSGLEGDKKELGKVHITPFPTNVVINLDVQNAYTEQDTLVIRKYRSYTSSNPIVDEYFPGPFTSGFLDSALNFPFDNFPIGNNVLINFGGPYSKMTYQIRSLPDYSGIPKHQGFYCKPICSGEFSNVTLVID